MLDFSDIYKGFLSQSRIELSDGTTVDNKYYRDQKDDLSPKKMVVLITRSGTNGKECLVYNNIGDGVQRYYRDTTGKIFDLYMGGDSVLAGTYGPRLRMPLCEGEKYTVSLVYADKALSSENAASLYDKARLIDLEFLGHDTIDNAYIYAARKSYITVRNSVAAAEYPVMKKIYGGSIPANAACGDVRSIDCGAEPGTAVEMLKNGGGEIMGSYSFSVDSNSLVSTDAANKPMCYADYVYKFKLEDLITSTSLSSDWRINYGIDTSSDATLREFFNMDEKSWVGAFWKTFDPFHYSLPESLGIYNTISILIEGDLWQFFRNVFGIAFFYLAKFMFWAMAYALVIHLWRKSAASGGMSIYWLLIMIIILLVVFGFISSYSQFVGYFRFGT
jgi:hypothetical protein